MSVFKLYWPYRGFQWYSISPTDRVYGFCSNTGPRYNVVIRPYCVIMRTALYWNEQQKMLVSLSCHICWSCTVCCWWYRLGYQISAAAPHTALNRGGPVQCHVEAVHVLTMLTPLLIYLPPPSCLAGLLWFITLTLLMNPAYSRQRAAPCPPMYSVGLHHRNINHR